VSGQSDEICSAAGESDATDDRRSWVEEFLRWGRNTNRFKPSTVAIYRDSLRDFDRRMNGPDHSRVTPRDLVPPPGRRL
jgi:hypothetical protein